MPLSPSRDILELYRREMYQPDIEVTVIFVNKFLSFNASILFSNCLDSFSSNSLYISMISLHQNYTLTRLFAREDIIEIT
jgi:hypothetical protein